MTNANGTTVNSIVNDENLEADSLTIVKKMFKQYPDMKQKIHHYIHNLLPNICENAFQQQKEREERKKQEKIIEDRTFGLKNKNKSKAVQK